MTTENTCVIDNLIGIYGEDLKLDRDGLIKLNKEFHGVVENNDDFDGYDEIVLTKRQRKETQYDLYNLCKRHPH